MSHPSEEQFDADRATHQKIHDLQREVNRLTAENKRLIDCTSDRYPVPVIRAIAAAKIIELLRPGHVGYFINPFDIDAIDNPVVRDEVKRMLEKRA